MTYQLKKLLLTSIATLFLATGTAHARNVDDYQCGKTKVTVGVNKDSGTPIGYLITVERGNLHPNSSGRLIFDKFVNPTYYVLGRKKFKCKMLPEEEQGANQ